LHYYDICRPCPTRIGKGGIGCQIFASGNRKKKKNKCIFSLFSHQARAKDKMFPYPSPKQQSQYSRFKKKERNGSVIKQILPHSKNNKKKMIAPAAVS
jgi:hypothetical protein